ncbi:hypothetical protein PV679_30750 [Streptomyces sp. AK02-01A]|nr:hypothetical protein [Streptomyces sp. AK02-01A]
MALPVVSPCDQQWAIPPGRYGAALDEFRQRADGDWQTESLIAWLKKHDAVAQNTFTLYLDTSTTGKKATLHDIRVKVISRKETPRLKPFRPGCGGPGYYHSFSIPLRQLPVGRAVSVREMYQRWPDQVALGAEAMAGAELDQLGADRARPLQLPLTMSSDDPESLRILAVAEDGYYAWELQLVWAVAGENPETHTVDFDGAPFRTAAEQTRAGAEHP